MREWSRANPDRVKARRANLPPANCHPNKKVRARGLCDACYRRQWRAENPERNRLLHQRNQKTAYARLSESQRQAIMLKRYGLTEADYERMRKAQAGLCAACRQPSTRRLQVDHCHETGRVRGLLCGNCNSVLGHAKDNGDRLMELIHYLQNHEEPAH